MEIKKRKIEGAIFDVDGTLLDTMHIWHDAGARFLGHLGIQAEEGLGDKLFKETSVSGAQYLIDNYGIKLSIQEIAQGIDREVENYYFTEADFKPGAKELLLRIAKENIPLTVATSTHRRPIEEALKRLGVIDLFQKIYTCRDLGTTKQEPLIFYEAEKTMGSARENTWVFEDGLYAIKTAKSAGYVTVGVYDKVSEKDQKEMKSIVDIYCKTLEELNCM